MKKHPTNTITMLVLLAEPRISLRDLARREGVHLSTSWRWCLRGCKGHRLECFNIGGKKYTTIPAFERWIRAVNGDTIRTETPHQREQAIVWAEQRADELGL